MTTPDLSPASDDDDAKPSDIELMARAGAGDEKAFEIVVSRYQQHVANHAYRMIGDMAAAEDVTQQTFVKAWCAASRYRPSAHLLTWLFRISRNLVFNELRRRRRKPAQSLDMEKLPQAFAATAHHSTPDAQASAEELAQALEKALLTLPEKQREAILLVRAQDLSYEEIAKLMRTSVSSVKSLIFRARTELKERLKLWLEP